MFKWMPFRRRYWLVKYFGKLEVRRGRINPAGFVSMETLVDGPFDTQEDAARALAFWQAQRLSVTNFFDELL